MKEKLQGKVADRRNFLKLAGVTAATGGLALASGNTAANAADVAEDQTERLYKESQHIRTYYDLARF